MLGGERPFFCIIFKNHKLLEVEPFYHISEYKLDRKCFHMIFLGKDLPMEAGMMRKRQCMPKKDVCCVSFLRKKSRYEKWGACTFTPQCLNS